MIRYLWFDLGYTLVATNREEVYQKTLERFAVTKTIDEITMAYHQADKLFMREYPGVLGKDSRTFLPWYVGTLNYFLGLSLPIEDLIRIHLELAKEQPIQWRAFEFTKPTLHCLKEAGYQLGLISNWDQSAREVLSRNQLEELFDEIIISSEVGVEKPDPAIFELALARVQVTAEQSLYVGDNYYDDVRGCQQVGIHCLLINPYNNQGIEELDYTHIIPSIQGVVDYLGLKSIPQEIK
ncbi:HAD family hydrolase [Paenibacillus aceti]|nr:HAD-IA family hydrolase [Paenibacillus aceti]